MSNLALELGDDEQLQSSILSHTSTESEKGGDGSTTSTILKKKRNLPGHPGKHSTHFFSKFPFI